MHAVLCVSASVCTPPASREGTLVTVNGAAMGVVFVWPAPLAAVRYDRPQMPPLCSHGAGAARGFRARGWAQMLCCTTAQPGGGGVGDPNSRVYRLKKSAAQRMAVLASGKRPQSASKAPQAARSSLVHDANMARIADAQTVHAVLNVVAANGSSFTPVNTSTALHRLARLSTLSSTQLPPSDGRVAALLALADAQVGDMRPRNLANTVWAVATLGVKPSVAFMGAWCAAAELHLGAFEAQHVANSLWALAAMGTSLTAPLTAAFEQAVVHHAQQRSFLARHVSICLWSLAALQPRAAAHVSEDVLKELMGAAEAAIPSFTTQNTANTLWALGRLAPMRGSRHAGLLASLAAHAAPRLGECTVQELSVCLWSFAALDWSPGADWLRAHEAVWREQLHTATPQSMATALLAWSKLKHMPQRLAWYGTCLRVRLREDTPAQAVANALCAFGTFFTAARRGASTPREDTAALTNAAPGMDVLDALAAHALAHMRGFSPGELTQTMWGFATLGYDPGPAWRAALVMLTTTGRGAHAALAGSGSTMPHLSRFTHNELSSVLWSFAALGVSPGGLWLTAWMQSAQPQWPRFEARHAVNVAWAAVVLRPLSNEKGAALLDELASRAWEHARRLLAQGEAAGVDASELLPHAGWCALYQAALVRCAEQSVPGNDAGTAAACDALLTPEGASRATTAWRSQAEETQVSRLQRDVSHALFSGLGVPHTLEKRLPGGLASVDIAIEPPGEGALKIAVEADGPRHFLRNRQRQPRGGTLLRNRLLAALGWHVVVIPYYDWEAAGGFDERVTYLRVALAPACPWLRPPAASQQHP